MSSGVIRGAGLWIVATAISCVIVAAGVALDARLPVNAGALGPAVAETRLTLLVFAPLLVAAVVGARLGGTGAFAAGRAPYRSFALGIAIGLGGMLAAVSDAALAGAVVPGSGAGGGVGSGTGALLFIWGLVLIVAQAGCEEVFFRGWLQPSLACRWGAAAAIVGSALAFALAHLAGGERAPLSLLNLLLGGLVFGLLARSRGGLAAALGAHAAWNAGEQLGLGLDPNPGVGSFGALIDRDLVGPARWGGSAEGLNASIPMTMVLVAILVALLIAGTRTKERHSTA